MRATPANDFAIVRDRERNLVVEAGNYGQCVESVAYFNRVYQSTAYVVERWQKS